MGYMIHAILLCYMYTCGRRPLQNWILYIQQNSGILQFQNLDSVSWWAAFHSIFYPLQDGDMQIILIYCMVLGILALTCQNQSQSRGLFQIYVYGHVFSLCIGWFCKLLQLLPRPRLALRQLKMISEQHSVRAAELGCGTYTELVKVHCQFESLANAPRCLPEQRISWRMVQLLDFTRGFRASTRKYISKSKSSDWTPKTGRHCYQTRTEDNCVTLDAKHM